MRISIIVGSLLLATSASAEVCTITYANDMGRISKEIYNHEYAHAMCPWWQHPKGMDPDTGKAYPPPLECLPGRFKGTPVSIKLNPLPKAKAMATCQKIRGIKMEGCFKCV